MFFFLSLISSKPEPLNMTKILIGDWKILGYNVNSHGIIRPQNIRNLLQIKPITQNGKTELTAILSDTRGNSLNQFQIDVKDSIEQTNADFHFLVIPQNNENKYVYDSFSITFESGTYGAISAIGSFPKQSIQYSLVMVAPNDFEVTFINSTNHVNVLRFWKIDQNASTKEIAQKLPLVFTLIIGIFIFIFSRRKVFPQNNQK